MAPFPPLLALLFSFIRTFLPHMVQRRSSFDGVTHAMFVRRCRACGTTLMILPRRKGNFPPLKQKESRALGYTKPITYFTKSLKCFSPHVCIFELFWPFWNQYEWVNVINRLVEYDIPNFWHISNMFGTPYSAFVRSDRTVILLILHQKKG